MNRFRKLSHGTAIFSTASALALLPTTQLLAAENDTIAEIIVTAQKPSENLQVVTVSDNLSYVLPEYDIIDVNANVQFDAVTVRLFIKNLADERAQTGGGTTVNGPNEPIRLDVNIIQPRTVGVGVDFQFQYTV